MLGFPIGSLVGLLIGIVLASAFVRQRGRAVKVRRSPQYWPHCPFCPPSHGHDGRLYRQSASVANANRDGESWRWAWCARCGAAMYGHEWHAPGPETKNTYREEASLTQNG